MAHVDVAGVVGNEGQAVRSGFEKGVHQRVGDPSVVEAPHHDGHARLHCRQGFLRGHDRFDYLSCHALFLLNSELRKTVNSFDNVTNRCVFVCLALFCTKGEKLSGQDLIALAVP